MDCLIAFVLMAIVIGLIFRGLLAVFITFFAISLFGPLIGIGLGIVAYFLLWIIFPERSLKEVQQEVQQFCEVNNAHSVQKSRRSTGVRPVSE